MELRIDKTKDGVKKYPLHSHGYYEIMTYINGSGHLASKNGDYPFEGGSVIIVPAGIEHGSVSENGFKNISIGGDFRSFFAFDEPLVLHDSSHEAETLATLVYENRYRQDEYLSALVSAYLYYLLRHIHLNTERERSIRAIVSDISARFSDSELQLTPLLQQSGYAEDYARALFRRTTGKTPNAFLQDLRIKHACFLLDVYPDAPLTHIAEQCGYTDYIYFSKQFKRLIDVSPRAYKSLAHDRSNA